MVTAAPTGAGQHVRPQSRLCDQCTLFKSVSTLHAQTTKIADFTCASAKKQGPDYKNVQRNLALELVRVTEAAALAGGKWYGRGDKNAADQVTDSAVCPHAELQCSKQNLAYKFDSYFGCRLQ